MPDIQIHRATSQDIPRLLPLIDAYWRFEEIPGFDPQTVDSSLRRFFAKPHLGAAWMAESDTVPVGYLLLVYVFSLEHGGLTAEIDELFVTGNVRGTGVGWKLVQRAETACREMGCRHLSLQVGLHNEAAKEFYRALGFVSRAGFGLLEKDLR